MNNASLERQKVAAVYPDYKFTVNRRSFRNWLYLQPKKIKNLIYSEKARDAILVLDKYHGVTSAPPAPSRLKPILRDALCWLIAGVAALVMLIGLLQFINGAGSARFVVVAICALIAGAWFWRAKP